MKNKRLGIYLTLAVMLMLGVGNALALTSCAGYTYLAGNSDGTDYFNVNSGADNTTLMVSTATTDKLWTGFEFFTPRLNFTVVVNETGLTGKGPGETYSIKWRSPTLVNDTFELLNVSALVNKANYTLYKTGTDQWILNYTTQSYNGSALVSYRYNRTFIKNVDDLVTAPGSIYTDAVTASFLVSNSTASMNYADTASFRINGTSLGSYITGKNWAVGWTYTLRTCAAVDQTSITGINNTKTTIFAGLALLAVLLIVIAAFGITKMVESGNVDMSFIAITIIGGGIVLMVGFVIVYKVATALIG